ncbi:uncharacterized protein [Macaca fascicularis]|uniref:uncharacterized protein n=1 Tax=Macaca fascicularis TaxID=9541 RepID=UPI003D155F41
MGLRVDAGKGGAGPWAPVGGGFPGRATARPCPTRSVLCQPNSSALDSRLRKRRAGCRDLEALGASPSLARRGRPESRSRSSRLQRASAASGERSEAGVPRASGARQAGGRLRTGDLVERRCPPLRGAEAALEPSAVSGCPRFCAARPPLSSRTLWDPSRWRSRESPSRGGNGAGRPDCAGVFSLPPVAGAADLPLPHRGRALIPRGGTAPQPGKLAGPRRPGCSCGGEAGPCAHVLCAWEQRLGPFSPDSAVVFRDLGKVWLNLPIFCGGRPVAPLAFTVTLGGKGSQTNCWFHLGLRR